MKRKNLKTELLRERNRSTDTKKLLADVRAIFENNERQRDLILSDIKLGGDDESNDFIFDLLETDRIFHISHIKKLCIDFRLRFLESKYFKAGIPEEAVTQSRLLGQMHGTTLKGYRIAAPGKSFHLQNYDDPLLFAPMGNDYYYLVHKWGNDLHPLRKWFVLPFKNLGSFLILCLIVSIILTPLVPLDNLSKTVPMATIIIFLFMFKSVVAVLMYGFFMRGKNFNCAIWNSKFYNN